MLTIRNAQMEAFRRHRTDAFLARLAAYLVDAAGVAPVAAAEQASAALTTARHFNLITQADVAEFARIVCLYLGGFPVSLPKPVQNLLLAYGVPGPDRLRDFTAWAKPESEPTEP